MTVFRPLYDFVAPLEARLLVLTISYFLFVCYSFCCCCCCHFTHFNRKFWISVLGNVPTFLRRDTIKCGTFFNVFSFPSQPEFVCRCLAGRIRPWHSPLCACVGIFREKGAKDAAPSTHFHNIKWTERQDVDDMFSFQQNGWSSGF